MKPWIKYLLLPLLVLLGIYLVLCALGPKNMDVSKEISIDAPAPIVYNLVNSMPRTAHWNPWLAMDTSMTNTYSGPTDGIGSRMEWTSATMGNGTQEIVESIKNQKVRTALTFDPDHSDINHADFLFAPEGKGTKTTWTFTSGSDIPFIARGFMYVLGMKKMMHTAYESGLKEIKRIAEERHSTNVYNGYKMEIKDVRERHFIGNRDIIKMSEVSNFYAANLGSLFTKVTAAGLEMDGMPSGVFYKWDQQNGTTDMLAGIPIKDAVDMAGSTLVSIPAKKAVVVDYYGNMANTIVAHEAIDEYLRDQGIQYDPPIVEEYLTDPAKEKDMSKWLTRITYYFTE